MIVGSIGRGTRSRGMASAAIAGAVLIAAVPFPEESQEAGIDAATARAMIAEQTHSGDEGWWQTSNARYRQVDDGEPDFFAMRFEPAPGGYALTGCMWGGRDGERVGPFWHFQSAWDPSENALLRYQVNPNGFVGIGHAVVEDGQEVSVQEVFVPGQPIARIRHLSHHPHPDTLVTRSFDDRDGEWVPRRHDIWVWTTPSEGEVPPC